MALVVAYRDRQAGEVLRPTLIRPDQIRIPVISAAGAVGDALTDAADAGREVRVAVRTEIEQATVRNVIADWTGAPAGW